MAMTREEKMTKDYIWRKLSEEGYPTYANIFWNLDLHLTAAPRVVGYMEPTTGTITINRNLDEDQFSVIIRHEILHNYLKHEKRLLDYLAELRGLDPDDLTELDIDELKQELYKNDTFNVAADYEISNRGYTEEDKQTVRQILLNGQELKGLVTEDDHPEWVDWSVEDMYDALIKEKKEAEQEAKNDMNDQDEPDEPDDEPDDDSGESGGPGQPGNSGNSGDSSDENPSGDDSGEGADGGDSSDGQDEDNFIYGELIDEHTFRLPDGTEYKIG